MCDEIGCPVAQPYVCALSTGCVNQGRDYYLKLCQHLPYDMSYGIYDYSETHPADACRMEAILMMLEKLNISGYLLMGKFGFQLYLA